MHCIPPAYEGLCYKYRARVFDVCNAVKEYHIGSRTVHTQRGQHDFDTEQRGKHTHTQNGPLVRTELYQ